MRAGALYGDGKTGRGTPQGEVRTTSRTPLSQEYQQDGTHYRYREVVQRREGVRLHHAGERREGLLRAPHRDPSAGVQVARRGRARRVRRRAGTEGSGGAERREALTGPRLE